MSAFLKRHPRKIASALGLALCGFWNRDSVALQAFGFGSSKVNDETPTKTFIWGNGFYQTGAPISFINFEPKHIKTFDGTDSPCLSKVFFGEGIEAGIDLKGRVFVWPKVKLPASAEPTQNFNRREGVVLLDEETNNKQIAFTKKFLWLLKEDGSVFQFPLEFSRDEVKNEPLDFKVVPKKRCIPSLADIKQIECGEDHFVALTRDGRVFSMGDDTLGQCGLGDDGRISSGPFFERRVTAPKEIPNLPVVEKIACGAHHTLAITSDGNAIGWGSNQNMQLSHEREVAKPENPLLVSYTPIRIDRNMMANIITDVAAGEHFSVFVTRNKANDETEVFACGNNLNGELGVGYMRHVQDVTKIEGLSNFTIQSAEKGKDPNVRIQAISCGKSHCMALLNIGTVLEWGSNVRGQMGNKKRVCAENPLVINKFQFSKVKSISCGYDNSAVVTYLQEKKEAQSKSN